MTRRSTFIQRISVLAGISLIFSGPLAKAGAAEVTATEALAKFDAAMAPKFLRMKAKLIVTKEDLSSITYEFELRQKNENKSRVTFSQPLAMRGQEILRVDNMTWIYLPDIKRATPISSRDTFQGGDFTNGDILRSSLSQDYTAEMAPKCDPTSYCIELTAKGQETTYRFVSLTLQKADFVPKKAEYFDGSRRLMRIAAFSKPKEFGKGFVRPTDVLLTNTLSKNRKTQLLINSLEVDVEIPDARFAKSDMGK